MIESIQRLLSPDTLTGLTTRPLPELRDLRIQCSNLEGDISLVRRLAQGRLDIVGHEVRRRATDDSGLSPDPGGILFDLPDLLADAPTPSGGQRGRPVSIDEPGPVAIQLVERLDAAAPPSAMASIGNVDENQLRELLEIIRSFELEMSAVRRQLHERIDSIQSEIGRRYRDGEASIDSLLG